MKNKNIAAVLSLFFGWLGVHRFYLGQPLLGVLYLLFFWTSIPFWISLIDAILFLVSGEKEFDEKYNKVTVKIDRRTLEQEAYRKYQQQQQQEPKYQQQRQEPRYHNRPNPTPQPSAKKQNNAKSSGIQKFKDYDFPGAIAEFKKSLQAAPNDMATHFNIACAYSMEEQPNEAFFHISRAVELGFKDFDRIHSHDSLAFIRASDQFDIFVKNNYRFIPEAHAQQEKPKQVPVTEKTTQTPPQQEQEVVVPPDLLDQFKKLKELRDKGFLTEAEYANQQKKLLG